MYEKCIDKHLKKCYNIGIKLKEVIVLNPTNIKAGDVYGYLTAIRPVHPNHKVTKWYFKCKCGNEIIRGQSQVKKASSTYNCGCLTNAYTPTKNPKTLEERKNQKYWHEGAKCNQDLTNEKFGDITVVKKLDDEIGKNAQYLCRCVCGKELVYKQSHLLYAKRTHCGCKLAKNNKTRIRLKRIHYGMMNRCYNKKNIGYESYYGKLGITVCEEWYGKEGFDNFYKWALENGYGEGLSIDRIDNYKGYSPNNCRWATPYTQSNNRRVNIHVLYKGEVMTLSMFAKKAEIDYGKAWRLVNEGCCYSGEYIEKILKN